MQYCPVETVLIICTNAHVFDVNMYVATSGCSGILQFPAQVPLGLWLAASACRLRLGAELSTDVA